tara:strand:- start:214 stop:834 length:621 start_codon:yes stop_codon:yes gene_type:complete
MRGGGTAAERIAQLFDAPRPPSYPPPPLIPPPPSWPPPPRRSDADDEVWGKTGVGNRRANDKVWVQVSDDDVQKWTRGTINSVDYLGEVSVKLHDGTIMEPGAENVVGYDKVWVQVNYDEVNHWMRGTINSVDYSGEVSVKLHDGTIVETGMNDGYIAPIGLADKLDKMTEQFRRIDEDERTALEARLRRRLEKSKKEWRRSRWRR